MVEKNLYLAAALVILAACSENPTSTDGTINAKHSVTGNPISGAAFWIDPSSNAKLIANTWRATRPADAAQLDKIAAGSQAQWFGGWNANILADVSSAVSTAAASNATPILVAYNIPQRDCGGLSAGGTTVDAYRAWIAAFANGLAGRTAVVILEPDALTQTNCLSSADMTTRYSLLQYAVQVLRAQGGVVYLDGGNSSWRSPSDQAARLTRANVAEADGFALNVSNFQYTSSSIAYGRAISALVGGKHFVIDTSRNGLGPTADNQWCNPPGRALGPASTTSTADPLVDAYLWIKAPGESDGSCNGAPAAGLWWPDYALGLAQRSAL